MPRRKNKNPRRHHVPPAVLFSRKRQLLYNLIRVLQRVGIEVRICRMRYRDNNYAYYDDVPTPPISLPLPPPSLPTSLYLQENNETLEQDTLPDSPSPCTPDFLADSQESQPSSPRTL